MKLRYHFFSLIFGFLLFSCFSVYANPLRDAHTELELIPEFLAVQPGQSFHVALRMEMDKGWHTYWRNPGDSGFPVTIQWNLPPDFTADPIQWPYPEAIDIPPLTSYGYEGEVFLISKIHAAQNLPEGETLDVRAKVNWLVCELVCVPGTAELNMPLVVSPRADLFNNRFQKIFKKIKEQWPFQDPRWTIRAFEKEDSWIIRVLSSPNEEVEPANVWFFPYNDKWIDHAAPQHWEKVWGGYQLRVAKSNLSSGQSPKMLEGILVAESGWGREAERKALEFRAEPEPYVPSLLLDNLLFPAFWRKFAIAAIFAFLGGLILNLMPCVLPVLAIKVLGLVEHASSNKRGIWRQSWAVTLGIVVSFWILAGLMLFLRWTGEQIGWGFQFQSPGFLIGMAVLFLVLALNLFGTFEIGGVVAALGANWLGTKVKGNHPFLSGVLITLVATPCTAPFMGSALGFAMVQPPLIVLAVFTFLGLGMAFPYLILCRFPVLLKRIPKPGPWMIHLKRFFGILFILTGLWLLWVFAVQQGFWPSAKHGEAQREKGIVWEKYSAEYVQQLRRENRPVLIDFTAAWCLTCQVNERLVLNNKNVVEKLKELDVATLKADWTNKDAEITEALASFGRNSVPLYVLYLPRVRNPDFLPEVLTPGTVLNALNQISD